MFFAPVVPPATISIESSSSGAGPARVGAGHVQPPRHLDAAAFRPAYDVAKLIAAVEAAPPDLLAVRELFAFCRRKNVNDADDWERSENLIKIAEEILKDPPRVAGVVREAAINEMRLQLAVRALRACRALEEGFIFRDVAWGLHRALKRRLHLFHNRFSRDPVAEFAVYEGLSVLGRFRDTETHMHRGLRKCKDAVLLTAAIASSIFPVFAIGRGGVLFTSASTGLGNATGATGMVALDLLQDLFARRPHQAPWFPVYDELRHRMTFLTKTHGAEHARLEAALGRDLARYHPAMRRIWSSWHRGTRRHRHAFFLGYQNIFERYVVEVCDPRHVSPCMNTQQDLLVQRDQAWRERTVEVLLSLRLRCEQELAKPDAAREWQSLLKRANLLLGIAKHLGGYKDAVGRWEARAELNELLNSDITLPPRALRDAHPVPPPPRPIPPARIWR